MFLSVLRLIFAPKTKIVPPKRNWGECGRRSWDDCRQVEEWVAVHMKNLFFFRSPEFGQKKALEFRPEDLFFFFFFFFFLRSPDCGQKNVSIWFKTYDNLSQVHSLLFQVSKKSPPLLRNPGYATGFEICSFITFDEFSASFIPKFLLENIKLT